MTTANEAYPWEQLPGESEKAYAAFLAFRDLGVGRSLEEAWRAYQKQQTKPKPKAKTKKTKKQQKVAKSNTRPGSSFYGWVREHRWWERAKAWDYYTQRLANMRFIAKREKLLDKQFKELDQIANLCANSIKAWLKKQKESPDEEIVGLSPFVAIQGIQSARKMQLEQVQQLALAQAQADAAILGDIEQEMEFFEPDGDEP